ncbi:hypothetical protein CL617_04385 [archaeon]|nr:hypothetical protein [archaeon]|tara:strand:+ start:10359 stop:11819 length:1461 start_codon:yes stop_codon:yes gene_type:complete
MNIPLLLNYYSRKDVQEELLNFSKNKEFVPKFKDSFGKRPDMVQYPRDILEHVKKGATSFHVSEERWKDPLSLKTGLTKKDLDKLRISWDFVIDVDFEVFECSKIIANNIVKALEEHKIKNIFVKFSGNKGFHILIPFESFPESIKKHNVKDLFPEAPKDLLFYINNYIDNEKNNFKLTKEIVSNNYFQEYLKTKKKKESDFIQNLCSKCNKPKVSGEKIEFVCPYCNETYFEDPKTKFKKCKMCKKFTQRMTDLKSKCSCGNRKFIKRINLALDTILISSRHLYRAPYSIHEKSDLVSLPIDKNKILDFNKDDAKPENIKEIKPFVDESIIIKEEARTLMNRAFSIQKIEQKKEIKEFDIPKSPIKIQNFPPCILLGLKGLEDGKKRFLFILLNFLKSSGYNHSQIKDIIYDWNKRNKEQLNEGYVLSQLSWHQRQKQVPPPNCPSNSNLGYYTDLNICKPDNLCKTIKNPAQYTLKKSKTKQKK